MAHLHSYGVTSLTEPGLGPGGAALLDGSATVGALDALIGLAQDDELTMRVTALLLFSGTGGGRAEDVEAGLAAGLAARAAVVGVSPRTLNVAGVKVFGDGIPRSGTAWLAEPYGLGPEAACGSLCLAGQDDDERAAPLARIVRAVDAAGLQVGAHLIGDAAVAAFLDAVESLPDPAAGRHYVIHGDYTATTRPAPTCRAWPGRGCCSTPTPRSVGRRGRWYAGWWATSATPASSRWPRPSRPELGSPCRRTRRCWPRTGAGRWWPP